MVSQCLAQIPNEAIQYFINESNLYAEVSIMEDVEATKTSYTKIINEYPLEDEDGCACGIPFRGGNITYIKQYVGSDTLLWRQSVKYDCGLNRYDLVEIVIRLGDQKIGIYTPTGDSWNWPVNYCPVVMDLDSLGRIITIETGCEYPEVVQRIVYTYDSNTLIRRQTYVLDEQWEDVVISKTDSSMKIEYVTDGNVSGVIYKMIDSLNFNEYYYSKFENVYKYNGSYEFGVNMSSVLRKGISGNPLQLQTFDKNGRKIQEYNYRRNWLMLNVYDDDAKMVSQIIKQDCGYTIRRFYTNALEN